MSQIKCRSCGHENAADSKFCGACGGALDLPPHLVACLRCGAVNPFTGSVCLWCHAKLPGPLRRRLRRWRTRVAIAATALAALVALGSYALLRDDAPRAAAAVGPAPTAAVTDAPVAGGPPAETPKAKAAVPTVARPQGSSARKAGERTASGSEACAEAAAALGLCGRTDRQEPARPQGCSEAVAALGLCSPGAKQGRE